MKPCLNCGKEWDARNCKHCGLNLSLWMAAGNHGKRPTELEMEEFLAQESEAKDSAHA